METTSLKFNILALFGLWIGKIGNTMSMMGILEKAYPSRNRATLRDGINLYTLERTPAVIVLATAKKLAMAMAIFGKL